MNPVYPSVSNRVRKVNFEFLRFYCKCMFVSDGRFTVRPTKSDSDVIFVHNC